MIAQHKTEAGRLIQIHQSREQDATGSSQAAITQISVEKLLVVDGRKQDCEHVRGIMDDQKTEYLLRMIRNTFWWRGGEKPTNSNRE